MFVIFRTELRIKNTKQKSQKSLVGLSQGFVDYGSGKRRGCPHLRDSPNLQARLIMLHFYNGFLVLVENQDPGTGDPVIFEGWPHKALPLSG